MRVLRLGLQGPDVLRWRTFLLGQKFTSSPTALIFDKDTAKATIAFQKHYKLVADGVAGIRTLGLAMSLGLPALTDSAPPIVTTSPNFPGRPNFPALTSTAARQRLFGKFAYRAAPTRNDPEAIRITDRWATGNITTVRIPQLIGVTGAPKTGVVSFHRLAAAQLVSVWSAWEKAGLLDRVLTWGGSYVPRFIRGSRTVLSNHAFGTAMDINVAWNPLGSQPTLVGHKGSVRELVQIANDNGFFWGGHFAKRPDGMHFEVAVIK